jgi:hypothetical protein
MSASGGPWTGKARRPQTALVSGGNQRHEVGAGGLSAHLAIQFATLALVLEVGSLVFYSAAAGFSSRLSVPPTVLLASGATGSGLIRWGSLVDMFGYLCIAPVALYLHHRYFGAKGIDLYTVAGLAVVVIGSIGAIVMATAAPPLIDQYQTASPAGRQDLEMVFGTLYRAVVQGLWQTLETIPAAVWLIGTASVAREKAPRPLFWILLLFGLANAGIALFRLSGL